MSRQITTQKEYRFSFPYLFEPATQQNGQSGSYEVTILIPKTDQPFLAELQAVMNEAIQQGMANEWGGVMPQIDNVRDGDLSDPEKYPMNRGHYLLKMKSKWKPEVFDPYGRTIMNADEVYGGMWGRVSFHFYPYNNKQFGRKGLSCTLDGVMKSRDDEKFGGGDTKAVFQQFFVQGAPQAQGFAAPQAEGFTAPQAQGFAAPQAQGFAAPQAQGFTAPQAQGFAAPQAQGFAAPQAQGFAAPQAEGFAQPSALPVWGSDGAATAFQGPYNDVPF